MDCYGWGMLLASLEGNRQRLDGGAMFGNCPRALWARWCPPDEAGRIELACRSLLVQEDSGRTILFEAGIGAFFPPKLRERYGVSGTGHLLLERLGLLGIAPEDVDVVVLSHLHFDHAGGLLAPYEEGAAPRLVFPRAAYVVGARAFARARAPHPRDRASFIPELPDLLEATGRLECIEGETSRTLGKGYRFRTSDGHTPGMILARLETNEGPLIFAADLVPGVPWIHVPITMGYDRYPERLVDEKRALLEDLELEGGRLFLTHDPKVAVCRVGRDERGRFVAVDPQPSCGDR